MNGVESKGSYPAVALGAGRFEDACDRFEAAWRGGERPRIEDYCDGAAPTGPPLIRELLVVELAYRRRLGETPLPDEYLARLPGESAGDPRRVSRPSPGYRPRSIPVRRSGRGPTPSAACSSAFSPCISASLGDDLIAAAKACARNTSRPFADVPGGARSARAEERDVLVPLTERQLIRHDGDPEQSLAAAGVATSGASHSQTWSIPSSRRPWPDSHLAARATTRRRPRLRTVGTPTSSGRRFRIVRLLDRGGLGEVYVAIDEELRERSRSKVIRGEHAADPDSRVRFLVEAEVTGRLEHPGVVPVYGLGGMKTVNRSTRCGSSGARA